MTNWSTKHGSMCSSTQAKLCAYGSLNNPVYICIPANFPKSSGRLQSFNHISRLYEGYLESPEKWSLQQRSHCFLIARTSQSSLLRYFRCCGRPLATILLVPSNQTVEYCKVFLGTVYTVRTVHLGAAGWNVCSLQRLALKHARHHTKRGRGKKYHSVCVCLSHDARTKQLKINTLHPLCQSPVSVILEM